MQTHSAARSSSPRRSKIEVDPVKLGRELAGLTGRAGLTDEEYARLVRGAEDGKGKLLSQVGDKN